MAALKSAFRNALPDVEESELFSSNLTDLGADSVSLIKLQQLISLEFRTEVPIQSIYEAPSLDALAERLIGPSSTKLISSSSHSTSSNTSASSKHPNSFPPKIDYEALVRKCFETVPSKKATNPPKSILLTGASGFLGLYLLSDLLLRSQARILLPVRSNDPKAFKSDLQERFKAQKLLWLDSFESRIDVVLASFFFASAFFL